MYGYPIYTWLFPLKAFKQVQITLCNGGGTRLHPLYAGGCSRCMTLLNYPMGANVDVTKVYTDARSKRKDTFLKFKMNDKVIIVADSIDRVSALSHLSFSHSMKCDTHFCYCYND